MQFIVENIYSRVGGKVYDLLKPGSELLLFVPIKFLLYRKLCLLYSIQYSTLLKMSDLIQF